jgi:acetolactate synthase-1/2/3 large subunit
MRYRETPSAFAGGVFFGLRAALRPGSTRFQAQRVRQGAEQQLGEEKNMEMNGAEIIMGILEREGIEIVSGIPGGSNLPLYHALGASGIKHVLARHEQAAGFIAQGMARRSGNVAVCFATSGPGVTNLLTAIADAKLDSVPIVAITGQVPRALLGTDAFQEIDTYGLSLPICKHSVLIKSAAELLVELPKAFKIARSGRPGPVIVDVPKDVQTERISFETWPAARQRDSLPKIDTDTIAAMAAAIDGSKRPVVYAGAGCISGEGSTALRTFIDKTRIPATHTLLALGTIDPENKHNLGMLGMHGTRAANRAIAECDLLIAVGARFDDRATGKVATFAPYAKILHIDLDAAEIGKLRKPMLGLRADAGEALRALGAACAAKERGAWEQRIRELKSMEIHPRDTEEGHPIRFLAELSDMLPQDAVIATDVGQHQMWAAQAIAVRNPRSFFTSGGLGTMGFGLPTAIGAALASPGKRVVCVSGDGSILMNIQELATLAELDLPVAVVLMDNGRLGLVRQQQELFYQERYTASIFAHRPDFAAIAEGFGIEALDLSNAADPEEALRSALTRKGPILIRYAADAEANVYPMVPPGAANEDALGEYVVAEKEESRAESA